jgi:hypothetical protein
MDISTIAAKSANLIASEIIFGERNSLRMTPVLTGEQPQKKKPENLAKFCVKAHYNNDIAMANRKISLICE